MPQKSPFSPTAARLRFKRILAKLFGKKPPQVDLSFVSPQQMKRINGAYRKKHYPTDVLSFEAPDLFKKAGHWGELILCTSVLKKQAKELGHSHWTEFEVLVVHGLLHLQGMDHKRSALEAKKMFRAETRLLRRLGYSNPRTLGLIARTDSDT